MDHPDEQRLLTFYRCAYSSAAAVPILAVITVGYAVSTARLWSACLAAALVAMSLAAVASRLRQLRSHRHIPGPKPSFLLGNLPALLAHGHGRRDRALQALHQRFGPIVCLHLAWGSPTYVALARVSKSLHRKDLDSYRHADRTVLPRSLMGVMQGEKHRAHRQLLMPFLTSHGVERRLPVLLQHTDELIRIWQDTPHSRDLLFDIHCWSAHSLGSFLFGQEWPTAKPLDLYFDALTAIEEEVSFRTFHPWFVRWIFLGRSRKVTAAYRYLYEFLEQILQQRSSSIPLEALAQHKSHDVLDELVRAQRSGNPHWSHTDCVEEMMSLVLGGTDAMSYVIVQALVLLSQNPLVQQRARESVTAGADERNDATKHPPSCPQHATQPALNLDLAYVRQIFYETLRLFPAVPFSAKFCPHQALQEQGVAIPAGTNIMWTKPAIGRSRDLFEDPDRFDPERFSNSSATRDSVSSFLPFGAGIRHCIGSRLSEQQCVLLLARIIASFSIEPLQHDDLQYRATVSVAPSRVPVRLTPIAPRHAVAGMHAARAD